MRAVSRAGLAALAFACIASNASAALFDDDEARARIEALRRQVAGIDDRLGKMEAEVRDRRALVDLAGQIDGLRGDLSRMRGQIEVLLNQAESADKRQKDLYLDIDTRLRKIEQAKESAAEKPAEVVASAEETRGYEAALNQFKLGNYPLAISALQGLLVTYPGSKLAPNAQYWIGMAYAAQRDYKNAIGAQQKVLAAWPDDAKAPDAMLNIATSQEAMGDRRGAQKTLEGLLEKYPASQAAASAKQRLQKR
jgi:tol-pal system protein YbgF